MDSDSICHTCARRDCPDVYILHKYMVKYKGIGIAVRVCPLYVVRDENAPVNDGKKEWA